MDRQPKASSNTAGLGLIRFAHHWFLWSLIILSSFLYGCGSKQIVISQPHDARPLPKQSLSTSDKDHLGDRLVRTARRQIGRPYVWGGSAPEKGFDCSGLVWWVYRRHGIGIPRVSHAQKKTGKKVNTFKPGDLVFFRTSESPKGLHVGLYAHEYAFIHSGKKSNGVRVDSLLKPYWRRRFIGARRIVHAE